MTALEADIGLSLRWVSFVTGLTPGDDYQAEGSEGVTPDLLAEVKRLSIAFHPHNQIRQFPVSRPVFLFWNVGATGDRVVTRIARAVSASARPILESYSVIFSPAQFREIGSDPFVTRDLDLHAQAKRLSQAGDRARVTVAPRSGADGIEAASPNSGDPFDPSPRNGERRATDAEVDRLEAFCRREAASGAAPPTFATWWESGKTPPPRVFDIVLYAAPIRGFSLRQAEEVAFRLVDDIRIRLPHEEREADATRQVAGMFLSRFVAALRSYDHATVEDFSDAVADAAGEIKSIGARLSALRATLPEGRPETAEEEIAALSERCDRLSDDLLKIKHPNPFAPRRLSAPLSGRRRAANARRARYNRMLFIAAATAATAVTVAVASYLQSRRQSPRQTKTTPHPHHRR